MNYTKRDLITIFECVNYDQTEVKRVISDSLEPFGGMSGFVKAGQRVALKPNLLRPSHPDNSVTTHPAVVGAVAELVEQAGGRAFIIDSPGAGIPFIPSALKRLYKECGYMEISPPVELNFDCRFKNVSYKEGKILKRFEILNAILEADVIINLPKVKTHSFTYITCGVKNLFGVVPGLYKPAYHGRFDDQDDFALMLIDLCTFLRPSLTICDGITGMEGDGPSWGRKKSLGLIASSANPFLVDFLISYTIGFDPIKIPGIRLAIEYGLCPARVHEINLVTEKDIEDLKVSFEYPGSFLIKRPGDRLNRIIILKILCSIIKSILCVKPIIDAQLCRGCGICYKSCPKGAIEFLNDKARIDYSKCIRCYCCHELCPYNSVILHSPPLNRMLKKIQR
ncbi:DUF362 domain-containing protein [bacterium]|nr:DUF362 domain-containing protein [bacterium]